MQPFDPLAGVSGLSQLVVPNEDLDATLQRVADLSLQEVEDCDMAGITLLRDGSPVTAVFTNPEAPEIDSAQYNSGRGPCLDAFHTGTVLQIADTGTETRWPEFCAEAAKHGVRSTLSLPLVVGETSLGALNLYSSTPACFGEHATALVFAAQAAVVLANSQAYWAAHQLSGQLERALASRAAIDQAKGILMATRRCSADDAFEILRTESNTTNRKLREVAADVIRGVKPICDDLDDASPAPAGRARDALEPDAVRQRRFRAHPPG
jgi:GAF domain-containing protein